jgi:hypothetical protein
MQESESIEVVNSLQMQIDRKSKVDILARISEGAFSQTHLWKQQSEIAPIDEGRQIDWRKQHSRNADSSKSEIRDPVANVRFVRLLQQTKQHLEVARIEEGRQIDCSDVQCQNADSPSSQSLLPDSNVTAHRVPHWLKQDLEIV